MNSPTLLEPSSNSTHTFTHLYGRKYKPENDLELARPVSELLLVIFMEMADQILIGTECLT